MQYYRASFVLQGSAPEGIVKVFYSSITGVRLYHILKCSQNDNIKNMLNLLSYTTEIPDYPDALC